MSTTSTPPAATMPSDATPTTNGNGKARRKAKHKKMAKEDRQNNKEWAEGARQEIMLRYMERFAEAKLRGSAAEHAVLEKLYDHYHAVIDWRWKDHDEPDPSRLVYDEKNPPPPESLSEAEEVRRKEAMEKMNGRIHRWMNYRLSKMDTKLLNSSKSTDNPFSMLVAKLAGTARPPKALQGWQQMLKEEKRNTDQDDDDEMEESGNGGVGERGTAAMQRFKALSPEEQAGLKKRAAEEAKRAKEEWKEKMMAEPSRNPEDIQKCIDNVKSFLYPIMEGIHQYTGLMVVTTIGGPFPNANGEIGTRTFALGNVLAAGKPFPKWQPERFEKEWVGIFKEFCENTFTPEQCRARALKPKPKPTTASSSASASRSSNTTDSLIPDATATTTGTTTGHRHKRGRDSDDDTCFSDDDKSDNDDQGGKRQNKKARVNEKSAKPGLETAGGTNGPDPANPTVNAETEEDLACTPETEIDFTDANLVARWNAAREQYGTKDTSQDDSNRAFENMEWMKDVVAWAPPKPPQTAAAWFVPLFELFGKENHGTVYGELLSAYAALEEAYGWPDEKKGKKGLGTEKRPKAIEAWINKGRQRSPAPDLAKTYARFGREMETWWLSLQPRWRFANGNKRPSQKKTGEDWNTLVCPGRNGLTSVVAGLQWWGKAVLNDEADLRIKPMQDWQWVVEDVTWVMKNLTEEVLAGKISIA